jgi:ABC-type thiamine transport system ATPase subunit
MTLWNLSLSVFSWVGMARTLPQLVHNLTHLSVRGARQETIYAKILVFRTVVVLLVSGYSSLSFPNSRTFMYLVICDLRRHVIVMYSHKTTACCCYFANIVEPLNR